MQTTADKHAEIPSLKFAYTFLNQTYSTVIGLCKEEMKKNVVFK